LFDIVDLFLNVLETMLLYVFTFIFYKRLILEKKQEKEKRLKVEKQIIL
jgi:glycopeptide antibiotics resistance protein